MVLNNDTLTQGLTQELAQTQQELSELQSTYTTAFQEDRKTMNKAAKQQFYR